MLILADVLQRNVVTVQEDESVFSACELMSSQGISCVIVLKKKNVHGIVTRRDVLEKAIRNKLNLDKTQVKKIMSSPVTVLEPKNSLITASAFMNAMLIKQIPVIKDKKLVGIVTQTDVVRNLNKLVGFDVTYDKKTKI